VDGGMGASWMGGFVNRSQPQRGSLAGVQLVGHMGRGLWMTDSGGHYGWRGVGREKRRWGIASHSPHRPHHRPCPLPLCHSQFRGLFDIPARQVVNRTRLNASAQERRSITRTPRRPHSPSITPDHRSYTAVNYS
jgi:hypothetical protein